jgi:hypothetical protein
LEPSNFNIRITEQLGSKEAEMRSRNIALALSTVAVLAIPTSVLAQTSKVAHGTVASIAGEWVTVKSGNDDLKFNVDSKTLVEARGAGTKASRAVAAGKPGAKLGEVLQTGQNVEVTYNDKAGILHATAIRVVPKAVGSTGTVETSKTSSGTVKAIGADWITITGSAGAGSSFEQTFKIAPSTKVFAKGASTATAAAGGKVGFQKLIGGGDHVNVSYHIQGDSLMASSVHVTMKAAH